MQHYRHQHQHHPQQQHPHQQHHQHHHNMMTAFNPSPLNTLGGYSGNNTGGFNNTSGVYDTISGNNNGGGFVSSSAGDNGTGFSPTTFVPSSSNNLPSMNDPNLYLDAMPGVPYASNSVSFPTSSNSYTTSSNNNSSSVSNYTPTSNPSQQTSYNNDGYYQNQQGLSGQSISIGNNSSSYDTGTSSQAQQSSYPDTTNSGTSYDFDDGPTPTGWGSWAAVAK